MGVSVGVSVGFRIILKVGCERGIVVEVQYSYRGRGIVIVVECEWIESCQCVRVCRCIWRRTWSRE